MAYLQHALHRSLQHRKTAAAAAAIAATAFAAAAVVLPRPAGALPTAHAICDSTTLTLTPASGLVPFTGPITITLNGEQALKDDVTADVGVPAGSEVRLAWSEAGLTPQEGRFGPANFADHQEFAETRSAFAVMNIFATGNITIQPFVRLSGPSGATATLLHRCFTVDTSPS